MKSLKELNEERTRLLDRAQAILDVVKADDREMTAEETAEYDGIMGTDDRPGAIAKVDDSIKREERMQAAIAKRVVDRAKEQRPDAPKNDIRVKQRHGKVLGFDSPESAFNAGCWFAATFLGHERASQFCNDKGIAVQNALSSTGGNSTGGFLVPEEMENAIVRLVETYGVFRQNCRVVPMSGDTLNIPRRTAGVTSYYVGEVPSSITESSPTFGMAQLIARVLAVRSLVSRDLADDAMIDLASFIANEVALSFAEAEDNAGFNGDGTSTYGGIVGVKNALAAGSEYEALAGNTAFSTLDLVDFESMMGKLPNYALAGSKWYISQAGYFASMSRLQTASGGNTVADIGMGPVLQFLGYPVVLVQKMNATLTAQTSTEGLCYFGRLDLAATMGSRRGIETQILRELYAGTRQIGIITTQRFDINVHERGDASNAGPLVGLKTPGA